MNHDLKNQAIAIIQGRSASVDTKLDLMLGLSVDIQGTVNGHEERMDGQEGRIEDLEAYPTTIKRVARFLVYCGGLAGAAVAGYKLVSYF